MVTPLIRRDFCGLLVTGLTGLNRTWIHSNRYLVRITSSWGKIKFRFAWELAISVWKVIMHRLFTKCEVKIAGYWPSSFLACFWTETELRSINSQKKNEANIKPSWSNKLGQYWGFIICLSGKFFLPEVQSHRRIWFIRRKLIPFVKCLWSSTHFVFVDKFGRCLNMNNKYCLRNDRNSFCFQERTF